MSFAPQRHIQLCIKQRNSHRSKAFESETLTCVDRKRKAENIFKSSRLVETERKKITEKTNACAISGLQLHHLVGLKLLKWIDNPKR